MSITGLFFRVLLVTVVIALVVGGILCAILIPRSIRRKRQNKNT